VFTAEKWGSCSGTAGWSSTRGVSPRGAARINAESSGYHSSLQASREEDRSYTEIADAIRAHDHASTQDVQQLWRRLVFNLLPEGPLRRYLSELAGIHEQREFFLLWVLGRDLPGAVTVEPADSEAWPPAGPRDKTRDTYMDSTQESAS